ncbi:MAG: hypothetical protein GXY77_15440 [Fibrobacter sp.]|nr:hypothetical protein [Fibrobacter sp.]
MKKRIVRPLLFNLMAAVSIIIFGCGKVPVKEYYILNYLPNTDKNKMQQKPYQVTIRLKEFDIEEAYNRPQIVYRQSPFQLRYYIYRVWAVKPTRMITDLVYKHLTSANLVSSIIRRFDEGPRPDYELSGMIEALEEYDSDELWFAHLAFRLRLVRLNDGKTVYTRHFDHRKRVFQQEPEYVIREMSSLMEYAMAQAINDIDVRLAEELGHNRLQITPETEQSAEDTSITEDE